jgi:hypothetical protein
MEALSVTGKPSFTADQIVDATDIQRRWKASVEEKLASEPYLVLLSGKKARAVIMEYDKFSALWEKANTLSESLLEMEALNRVLSARLSGERLIPFKEVMAEAGITKQDLDKMPDVKLDPE